MDEARYRRFDAIMKVASTVVAVIAFFGGLDRFSASQRRLVWERNEAERVSRDREWRHEVWQRQLDLVVRISGNASRIAATAAEEEDPEFKTAVRDFEQMYWDSAALIDAPELMKAMDDLRHEIRYFADGLRPLPPARPTDEIKRRAYAVATACRLVIHRSGTEFSGELTLHRRCRGDRRAR